MTSPGPAETPEVVDLVDDPTATLSQLASTVLIAHTEENGCCIACGSNWPCTLAALAEHHLAGI